MHSNSLHYIMLNLYLNHFLIVSCSSRLPTRLGQFRLPRYLPIGMGRYLIENGHWSVALKATQ